MNEYLTYIGIGAGLLLVSLLIPGIKVLTEPIAKGIMEIVIEVFKHKGSFVIWFIKTIYQDHLLIFRHMLTSKDTLDPTQRVREEAGQ